MQVTVRLFAALRERAGSDELRVDGLPEPLDLAGLKRELCVRHPELGSLDAVRGVVGTRYVPDETAIDTGAVVCLLPPVSGGAAVEPLERGVFEISAEPLDVQRCQQRVAHPSCGAVLVFTGTTREHNRDRAVERLDYEAFEEMAGAEMERIFAECVEHFGPGPANDASRRLRMLCQHRTGTVGVGEPSVAIAVASPHRDAAFAACRYLIDELKARVPLWKKEIYGDGHHWIGDRS